MRTLAVRYAAKLVDVLSCFDRIVITGKTRRQISHCLQRCRVFGLRKKCGKTNKYFLTKFGRRTLLAAQECA